MGQQQLLLLVLGIVVVSIAVMAGLSAFSEGEGKAEHDAMMADAMRIASNVQVWNLKPTALGGGGGGSWANVSLSAVGIEPNESDSRYRTASACFALSGGDQATLEVYATDCTTAVASVTISDPASTGLTWQYAQADASGGGNAGGNGNGNGNGGGNRGNGRGNGPR